MEDNNTNWSQSVGCVVVRNKRNEVLLGRHTYGKGKGKLILPGGYVKFGELPEETAVREVLEETGILVKPGKLLGVRCNRRDWYLMLEAEYLSGEAYAADDENSEVIWLNVREALEREDVPELTKEAISNMLYYREHALIDMPYNNESERNYQYYSIRRDTADE